MKQPWDTALALCAVEDTCVKLKQVLCEGSFLKGYTPKPLDHIEVSDARELVANLEEKVAFLKGKVNE